MAKGSYINKDKKLYKNPVDSLKWCRYIVNTGHITAALIILGHVIWYFAARNILAWPADVYLRNWIIYPAIAFFILNYCIDKAIRSDHLSLTLKEQLSLLLFVVYSLYLSLTHQISRAVDCSFLFPIFTSTIFSNIKLTRRISYFSVIAVLLSSLNIFLMGKSSNEMIMDTLIVCFLFLCSYLLAKVLILYSHDNIKAIIASQEESSKNELAFLQAQIKPHFIYNSINTVVSFCYMDQEKAADLLVNLSKYLRLVFDVDRKSMLVPLEQEIEVIKIYTSIEKARFGDLVNVEYNIDPELLDKKIPSFCIQPLVENAIKHGLLKKASGGTVNISTKKHIGAFTVIITDDGIGMSSEKLDNLKNDKVVSERVGFSNVLRRIESWPNARLDIKSEENKGTTVTIIIPDPLSGGAYD